MALWIKSGNETRAWETVACREGVDGAVTLDIHQNPIQRIASNLNGVINRKLWVRLCEQPHRLFHWN